MSRARFFCALLVTLAVLLPEGTARAADACPPSARPVVVLVARVKPPDQVVADALRDHLRTELRDRGIDLCVGSSGTRKAIATVLLVIDRPERGPVTALMRIGDAVTDKRVERTMDLTHMPPDARALAVSAATDELLRATWAELVIADAPKPKMKPPEQVMTAVVDSLRIPQLKPSGRALQLGVLGSARLSPHMLDIGPEVWGAFFFLEHVGVTLRLQLGFTPTRHSENGTVRASTQGAQAGLAFTLNPIDDRAGLEFDAGAGLERVAFTANANAGAIEASTADWSAEAAAGPRAWLSAGPVRLTLGAELVYALRPTAARDAGRVVIADQGFGGRVSLGVLMHWVVDR